MTKSDGKKTPLKVSRKFPLKPRFQHLLMSSKTAIDIARHYDKWNKDRVMRHPTNSKVWKHFDQLNSNFALDPGNVWLGLVADGFYPFTNMSTPYSIWPVMLVSYNLPLWLSLKEDRIILSMIIHRPNSPCDVIVVNL